MFFSSVLFTKRGNLAKVWLAAHHQDKRLTKAIVVSTNIEECSHELSEPTVPLSLRISGQLLLGVVRIYQRKVRYLQEDTQEALTKVRMTSRPGSGALELHPSNATASSSHITFVDAADNDFLDFAIPDIPLNRLEEMCNDNFAQHELARAHDITLEDDDRFSYNLGLNQGAKQFENVHDVLGVGEEEDVIEMEPYDTIDQSIEIGRDMQGFDVDDTLPAIDIGDIDEFAKRGEVDSVAAAEDVDMLEDPIPLLDNHDIVSNADNDRSVLGSVDVALELDGEIDIAVRKSRKRKRPKLDRATQLTSAEIMDRDTSKLVMEKSELLTEPEPNLFASSSGDVPDFLLAPAIGPLADDLVALFADGFRKGTTEAAAESPDPPVHPEDEAAPEPVELPVDDHEPVEGPHPEFDDEVPAPFFDDDLAAMDHDRQSALDDDAHCRFEEEFIGAQASEQPLPDLVDEEERDEDDLPPSSVFSAWSDRTKKMYVLLSERLSNPESDIKLQSLIAGKSRSTAAVIFLETLILKTHGFIDLDQAQPYGEIGIKRASRFRDDPAMVAVTG